MSKPTETTSTLPTSLLISAAIHYKKMKDRGGRFIVSGMLPDGKYTWATWYGPEALKAYLNKFNENDREFIKKHSENIVLALLA